MKKLFLLQLVCLSFFSATAQNSFSFSDTLFEFNKTTAYQTLHWYFEINNHLNTDTTLRWKANFSEGFPKNWVITFDDQNSYYYNLQHNDSADFTLYKTTEFPQKLIIGNTHNKQASSSDTVRFDIYFPDTPGNVKSIYFIFNITENGDVLNVNDRSKELQFNIYPNPFIDHLTLNNFNGGVITVYSTHGKLIKKIRLPKNTEHLYLDKVTPGNYLLQYNETIIPITKY